MKGEGRDSEVPGEDDSCFQGAQSGNDRVAPFLPPELSTKVAVENGIVRYAIAKRLVASDFSSSLRVLCLFLWSDRGHRSLIG